MHKPDSADEVEHPKRIGRPAASTPASDDEIRRVFAAELSRLRGLTGLSQRQLATRMGCNRVWISKLENAQMLPTIVSLINLGAAFGIPAWQILKNAEESDGAAE
jgi:ribosome-binding protein aMBF1 (putative translation factor)